MDKNKPPLSFQVITDTHVTVDREHDYNKHFEQALLDIASQAPASDAIIHVGDLTDHGFEEEYDEFKRIWSSCEDKLPPLYITTGNHDVGLIDASSPEKVEALQRLWDEYKSKLPSLAAIPDLDNLEQENWDNRSSRFLSRTGNKMLYHDHWLEGYHFIFLSTEAGLERYCTLSEAQLEWLEQRLAENAAPDKPIFVFLHQPLKNTVAGSMEHQDWHGVTEDEQLRAILQQFPQVVMFTGHTHWELGSPYTYNEAKPAMFNAASVAYLWTDEDEYKYGSQGYYVEVYDGKVLVRGRDFVNKSWIEEASFTLQF